MPLFNQRRMKEGKSNGNLELPENRKINGEKKEGDGEDNRYKFPWSQNDLGRHCKDPLSSSKDWDETNSEMNKEMKNHSGLQRPAAKDANWK